MAPRRTRPAVQSTAREIVAVAAAGTAGCCSVGREGCIIVVADAVQLCGGAWQCGWDGGPVMCVLIRTLHKQWGTMGQISCPCQWSIDIKQCWSLGAGDYCLSLGNRSPRGRMLHHVVA